MSVVVEFITLLCLLLDSLVETDALVVGSYYSSPGVSSSTCSVSPCLYSSCQPGTFLGGCSFNSPGTCSPCTNTIPGGQFYSSYGTASGVCTLDNCPSCPQGQYKTGCGGGDGTSQGICSSCGPPPAGKYWDVNLDATSNCPMKSKKVCSAGYYTSGATDTSEGVCTACSGLNANHYWTTPVSSEYVCTQLPQTKCDAGYVSSIVTSPSTISAGTCSQCPSLVGGWYYLANTNPQSNCPKQACSDSACSIGQYIKSCGGTSPGYCDVCTNAPNLDQVYSSKGGWIGNCEVTGCPMSGCSIGQYVVGCGGAPSGLSCGQCTNAIDHSTYYIGIGFGPTDCATDVCPTCENGYYNLNCMGASSGTCTACNN